MLCVYAKNLPQKNSVACPLPVALSRSSLEATCAGSYLNIWKEDTKILLQLEPFTCWSKSQIKFLTHRWATLNSCNYKRKYYLKGKVKYKLIIKQIINDFTS